MSKWYQRRKKQLKSRIPRAENRIARGDEWASLHQKINRDNQLLAALKHEHGGPREEPNHFRDHAKTPYKNRKRYLRAKVVGLREPDPMRHRKTVVSNETAL